MMVEETQYDTLLDCQHLDRYWDFGTISAVRKSEMGSINQIRILTTNKGRFVLRIYRKRMRDRIDREMGLLSWLRSKEIPVVLPIQTRSGTHHADVEEKFITLLPYINDRQIDRDMLSTDDIEAMGKFLGHLHNVLDECPLENIPELSIEFDRDSTLKDALRLKQIVRSIKNPDPTDLYAMKRLETRETWLKTRDSEDVSELETLNFHVVHGDYQNTNVFFNAGGVSAIIDWDKIYKAPGSWEIVRTLHLMFGFNNEPSEAFIGGYRTRREVSLKELDISAHCYGLMRAYDLWLFKEIYDEGNDRVRKFLKSGEFVPIETDWNRLRKHLQ